MMSLFDNIPNIPVIGVHVKEYTHSNRCAVTCTRCAVICGCACKRIYIVTGLHHVIFMLQQ